MRALVFGARGAVGSAASAALRQNGHEVVGAGRRAPEDGVAIDASTSAGRARLRVEAARADVVLDASGLESAAVQAAVGVTPLVDVSATALHLERLATGVPEGGAVLLGAGIAPGLSTVLIRALDPQPGEEIDVAIMLGAGEAHGPAAVEWTMRLAGDDVYAAPEAYPVANLRSRRKFPLLDGTLREHLRADFPDDLLVGRPLGVGVRSWLALDSRLATAALRLVGAVPSLAPLLRHAPHLGGEAWSVTAVKRGSTRPLTATGEGQSGATGRLAAIAAERLVELQLRGAVTTADAVRFDELERAGDIRVTGMSAIGAEVDGSKGAFHNSKRYRRHRFPQPIGQRRSLS
ncbi:NAD-dependent epimerase/dehydratase family protein [Microbacterium murale]|uniref:NAD(P)-dependent dehydrogenase (Short-subunit alcohol dehydrogenase family) n=1 Tax=Microbacterium murale TaxID=1081040 RepID=A0ABU0P3W6_9MICO|nr:NAD-dependent epimerase/dehydratase family protein [Microbacterium murale]MDQ0642032.1 NAD(P)-dependent dehydrogenase (short-subunit alcohol dehydrogenase family) [Microbacterium murale]